MRVYIFHYHLNPGGVTRIIDLQIEAIRSSFPEIELKIITGFCPDINYYKQKNIEVLEFEELNYLSDKITKHNNLYDRIYNFFQTNIKTNDILHIHNLNLGKNPLVTLAVSKLAKDGLPVLNHTHDFSEDRPLNHKFLSLVIENSLNENLHQIMYPGYTNYIFAVLNLYDFERLLTYGVAKEQRYLLPNPVFFTGDKTSHQKADMKIKITSELGLDNSKLLVTYPVRAIHRKNIAEFVLLASLFRNKANWLVTQPPKNPKEIPEYLGWKKFCSDQNIPIIWEAGEKANFEEIVAASDFCITTSIREGFGMVFLEPWLLETPVIGRDLPMVTPDLKLAGIEFPGLYNTLFIDGRQEIYMLETDKQMDFISQINNSQKQREKLFETNNFLKDLLNLPDENLINKNKEVILKEYSPDKYGQRLHEIYRRLVKKP